MSVFVYCDVEVDGDSVYIILITLYNFRYHLLDLDTTIRGNLIKKSVVEFPTILIISNDHKYAFDIYDSGKRNLVSWFCCALYLLKIQSQLFLLDDESEQWKGNWEVKAEPPSSSSKPQKSSQNKNNFLFGGSDCSSEEEA